MPFNDNKNIKAGFRTSSAQRMVKEAQIMPIHTYDHRSAPPGVPYNYYINNKQKSLVDTVLGQESGQSFYSPLLNLILDNNNHVPTLSVSASDKDLLMKVWNTSSSTNDKMEAPKSFSSQDLNRLKAKGLVTGFGHNLSITSNGRKLLVEMILDSKSTLTSMAHNMTRIIKTCQMDHGMEKVKIVRTPDGKWIAKPEEKNNAMLENKTKAELLEMHKVLTAAESDYLMHKNANSKEWDSKYNIEKLIALKNDINVEINKR